ncbi:hypothetical protein BLSMQ_0881 [Brevibacterium aurantiacum]|uniref:Uncharacterized protein n=1 Tax=Brevibacterium aurantiacum TaxID=273384 RepID=A0A1D7W0Q4_BREAU|nr:hypothetical protein BLSMQ_0881 [Brevibacterium aurantiacum]
MFHVHNASLSGIHVARGYDINPTPAAASANPPLGVTSGTR